MVGIYSNYSYSFRVVLQLCSGQCMKSFFSSVHSKQLKSLILTSFQHQHIWCASKLYMYHIAPKWIYTIVNALIVQLLPCSCLLHFFSQVDHGLFHLESVPCNTACLLTACNFCSFFIMQISGISSIQLGKSRVLSITKDGSIPSILHAPDSAPNAKKQKLIQ